MTTTELQSHNSDDQMSLTINADLKMANNFKSYNDFSDSKNSPMKDTNQNNEKAFYFLLQKFFWKLEYF